jgi:hypothetical protein
LKGIAYKNGLSTGRIFDYLFSSKLSLSADKLYGQKGFGNYFVFFDALRSNGYNTVWRQADYFP